MVNRVHIYNGKANSKKNIKFLIKFNLLKINNNNNNNIEPNCLRNVVTRKKRLCCSMSNQDRIRMLQHKAVYVSQELVSLSCANISLQRQGDQVCKVLSGAVQ